MKVSLKVREERTPLVRAKLPLNVLGLPLFTGITTGDSRELALHVGTYVQAGPAFRLSYKPNNVFSPFSVLVKTGFGLWGSPNGAGLALSAEFDLNSTGAPTFSVRVKPRFGDFGLRKDTRKFKTSCADGSEDEAAIGSGEISKSVDTVGEAKRHESGTCSVHQHDEPPLLNENGSKSFSMEEVQSTDTREKTDRFKSELKPKELEHLNGVTALRGNEFVDDDERSTNSGVDDVEVVDLAVHGEESRSGRQKEWLRGSEKGWSINAHSSLPFGKRAVARVRWQLKFGSNLFHDIRHGLHITDIKLPNFTVDKVSFEALDPLRQPSVNGTGEDTQLGRIAALCGSMRYQLQLLHSENKVLKNTLDELRGDLGNKKPAGKGPDLVIQEGNALRSQMFDELNRKVEGGSRSKGREGSSSKDMFPSGDSLDLGKAELAL